MLFQNRPKNPIVLVPIGMMFLVIAILWPSAFHPATQSGQDWNDGLRGLLFGVSIGINLMAVVLAGRQRRREAKLHQPV